MKAANIVGAGNLGGGDIKRTKMYMVRRFKANEGTEKCLVAKKSKLTGYDQRRKT